MVWTWVVEVPVYMVPARLDLGGRDYDVYGVCWFGPGWSGLWCLWCLMVRTWVVGAMCLWRLLVWTGVWAWVVGLWRLWFLMFGSSVGGRGYGISGVCIGHLHRGVWSARPWVIYA